MATRSGAVAGMASAASCCLWKSAARRPHAASSKSFAYGAAQVAGPRASEVIARRSCGSNSVALLRCRRAWESASTARPLRTSSTNCCRRSCSSRVDPAFFSLARCSAHHARAGSQSLACSAASTSREARTSSKSR
eukprot:scaffold218_cov67-Phaeocystis_antarctica.AAC.5